MRNISVLGFGATYIRGLMVYPQVRSSMVVHTWLPMAWWLSVHKETRLQWYINRNWNIYIKIHLTILLQNSNYVFFPGASDKNRRTSPHHARNSFPPPTAFSTGAHFMFVPLQFKLWYKFGFTLILILTMWLLQNFAHDTTAVLSCHVQKFVAIWWSVIELQQGEVSIKY